MAIGAAFGLLVPGWSAVASWVVVALLGFIIYLACFRIGVLSIRTFPLPRIVTFFLLRFVALPIVVFFCAQALLPKYVLPLVVLTALPAGVAAAFTGFLGGAVSLAFVLVVLTNLSTPILVPLVMRLTAGIVIHLDFLSGWYLYPARSREDRIACTISSGCNNVALGVSIAAMYFPPEVGLFLIISEIPWMLGPVVMRRVLGRTT